MQATDVSAVIRIFLVGVLLLLHGIQVALPENVVTKTKRKILYPSILATAQTFLLFVWMLAGMPPVAFLVLNVTAVVVLFFGYELIVDSTMRGLSMNVSCRLCSSKESNSFVNDIASRLSVVQMTRLIMIPFLLYISSMFALTIATIVTDQRCFASVMLLITGVLIIFACLAVWSVFRRFHVLIDEAITRAQAKSPPKSLSTFSNGRRRSSISQWQLRHGELREIRSKVMKLEWLFLTVGIVVGIFTISRSILQLVQSPSQSYGDYYQQQWGQDRSGLNEAALYGFPIGTALILYYAWVPLRKAHGKMSGKTPTRRAADTSRMNDAHERKTPRLEKSKCLPAHSNLKCIMISKLNSSAVHSKRLSISLPGAQPCPAEASTKPTKSDRPESGAAPRPELPQSSFNLSPPALPPDTAQNSHGGQLGDSDQTYPRASITSIRRGSSSIARRFSNTSMDGLMLADKLKTVSGQSSTLTLRVTGELDGVLAV
ncbi:hypothetical protein AAMO2058_001178900 [Amorphochlora amoebiformis]